MEDALDRRAFSLPSDVATGDGELAVAARDNPAAFGELYDRYHARIYRYVVHRVGTVADAEDITSQVFMKALEALPGYQPRRNGFAPWLFRIAHNAVVDHYRRHRHQTSLEHAEPTVGRDNPEQEVIGYEQVALLSRLTHQLSPEQRDVVLMRYVADLSFAEIAETLKKNEPAIRMLLHRGLRKLKAVMDGEPHGD